MARLELDRLSKAYNGRPALTELSFHVEAGEIFGFVGSNGAGKTTAMRIALGVLASDSGEVRWKGERIDFATRRRIGYMPEERGLYPKMKVGEQLVYLARLHGLGAEAATSAMEQWTDRLGVGTRRDDDVEKLSLGNQQRVQLAAALVHDPEILVLDEPFSGLDPVAVDIMSEVLQERARAGVPVVFSSHQLDLVERLCDRVGIVKAGQMVAVGSIEELRTTDTAQWRVTVAGAPSTWADSVPGVRVVGRDGDTLVVELPSGDPGGEQPLVRAAVAAGELREFSRQLPHLADLFRDVVSSEEPGAEETGPPPSSRRGWFGRGTKEAA